MQPESSFDFKNSPLKEIYVLLNASNPSELSSKYTEEDQRLMHAEEWDYENARLLVNRVRSLLESVDSTKLSEEEQYWRQNMLWLWYHHAISCAIWRYQDKESAQRYATKALEYQPKNHPNRITRLLYLLVNNRLEEAEKWRETIDTEPEQTTAKWLVREYETKGFV